LAAVRAEPPGSAGDIGKRGAGCDTGAVDLGLILDDQALGRGDPGGIEQGQRELTGRTAAAAPGEREVGAVCERSRDRGDAIRGKDLGGDCGQGRKGAHAGRETIGDRGVPGVAPPGVLDVERVLQLRIHVDGRRRAGLGEGKIGLDHGHRQRRAWPCLEVNHVCRIDRFVEPHVGTVAELRPCQVHACGVVIEDNGEVDLNVVSSRERGQGRIIFIGKDQMLAGIRQDAGVIGEPGTARPRRQRCAAIQRRSGAGARIHQPGRVAHMAESRTGCGEVVGDDDIGYLGVISVGHIVEGARGIQFAQERHGDRVAKGDTDGSSTLGRWVLLTDGIHRHHKGLAGRTDVVEPTRRPIDPEVRLGRVVARHVAVVVNVGKSDVVGLLLGKVEIDVGDWEAAHGLREVLYRAVHVDPERGGGLNGRQGSGVITVDDPAELGAENPRRLGSRGHAQRQEQKSDDNQFARDI